MKHLMFIVAIVISGLAFAGADQALRAHNVNMRESGVEMSGRIEPAEQRGGLFSLHTFRFNGRGPELPDKDGERLRGSSVDVKWSIQWPGEKCGLTKEGAAKVREAILRMAFGPDKENEPERQETDKWKPPADLEEVEVQMAAAAMRRYRCDPIKSMSPWWSFVADVHLEWPFGVDVNKPVDWWDRPVGQKDEKPDKWYSRQVLVVWNDGYSNYGANGCSSYFIAKTFSIPDGRELTVDDYFAKSKQDELAELARRRLLKNVYPDEKESDLDQFGARFNLKEDFVYMRVTKDGITWYFRPYSLFAGANGVTSVSFKWDELARFAK